MASNRIARSSLGAPGYSGSASGLAVDSDLNQLVLNIDGTQRPLATSAVERITVSKTTTTAASGTTFICNSTTSIIVTLPSTQAGLRYRMIVEGVTGSGGHGFSPAAADKVQGTGLSKADDADLVCTYSGDALGNFVDIIGDGIDGWWIVGSSGTWA